MTTITMNQIGPVNERWMSFLRLRLNYRLRLEMNGVQLLSENVDRYVINELRAVGEAMFQNNGQKTNGLTLKIPFDFSSGFAPENVGQSPLRVHASSPEKFLAVFRCPL